MPRANSRTVKKTSSKCMCNPGWLILALIFFSFGLYALVGGFTNQFFDRWNAAPVVAWYFLGALLMAIAKMLKWKSCGTCQAHK